MDLSPERLQFRPWPIAAAAGLLALVLGFLIVRNASPGIVGTLAAATVSITLLFVFLHDRFEEAWRVPEAVLAVFGWVFIVGLVGGILVLWAQVSGVFGTIGVVLASLVIFTLGLFAYRWFRERSTRLGEALDGTLGSLGLGVVLAGLWLIVWLSGAELDLNPSNPNPGSGARLVAMGDSYMSGEGAQAYFAGTNSFGSNECRRTSTAHPYRTAQQLDLGLTFLACSGATTEDVRVSGQYNEAAQLAVLNSLALDEGSVVLVSIGGNDAGFTEIALACTAPSSCIEWGDSWLADVRDTVRGDIEDTLREIRLAVASKSGSIPVFVTTYPQIMTEDGCDWTWLTGEEHEFLGGAFTTELNTAVRIAAANAGVNVISLDNAFADNAGLMCDGDRPDDAATNFISASPVDGLFSWDPRRLAQLPRVVHNSFHPKPAGHDLMDDVVVTEIRAKWQRMAAGESANPVAAAPATNRPDEAVDCEALGAECPKALASGDWVWIQILGLVTNVAGPALLAILVALFLVHWGLAPSESDAAPN